MSEHVDVSIIIPSFNSEPFLKRSVLSCLSQTGVTYEVIVVDDEGKDFTRDILETIKLENPEAPLQTIYRPGGLGQSTARNAGMEVAQGRYIALLDSDDGFCADDVLAKWVAEADASQLEMSIARFYNVSPAMVRRRARSIDLELGSVQSIAAAPQLVNVVSCWQILYRRSFLEENGVIFSPKLKQREDRLFVVEALLKAQRVGISSLFVVDHYNVVNSSFKQIDAGQLQQYNQHLKELNAAFSSARQAGRSNVDFEHANAIIYLRQMDEYWAPLCRRLATFERTRPLVDAYFDEMRLMSKNLSVLYTDDVLDTGEKDGFLREGRMDLIRLALKTGQNKTLLQVLKHPKPPLKVLADLRKVDETGEEVVTRALSFRGNAPRGTSEEETPPLRNLVKRIILHTGLPKTGSSSLQQVLERNRFKLLEAGIHYPIYGTNREHGIRRERTPGHVTLVQSILAGDRYVEEKLAAEVRDVSDISGKPVHTLILSAENIVSLRFWANGEQFGDLASFFEGVELEVVCVFRHPTSWLRSLYVEMCGNPWNGFNSSLEDFASSLAEQGLFDFDKIASTLQAPPQVTKLHRGCFETIRSKGGIEPWFFDLFRIKSKSFEAVDRALSNESMSPHQASVLRNLKRLKELDREDLGSLFTSIKADRELADNKAITTQMAEGLSEFKTTFSAEISAYERAYGQTSPNEPPVGALELERLLDTHLAGLTRSTPASEEKAIKKFFDRLRKAYGTSNWNRIIQINLEDRRISVGATLGEGEDAAEALLHCDGASQPLPLLKWEDGVVQMLDTGFLKNLWEQGKRDVEIELPLGHRVGRRPFRVVKLLPDDSHWLIPPAFLDRFRKDGLGRYWR